MKQANQVANLFLWTGALIMGAGGFATIAGFYGNIYWVFDLFAHFREYYLLLFLFGFFIASWYRLRLVTLYSFIFFTINVIPWLSFYIPVKNIKPATSNKIIIYTANVQTKNTQYELVLNQIQEIDPDIIVLSEVDPKWIEEVKNLYVYYPYFLVPQFTKKDEIILMSKYPIVKGKILHLGSLGRASIVANIRIETKLLTLIATHPLPPVSKRLAGYRDEQLMEIGEVIKNQKLPTILVGDLNITPFSYPYRRLVKNAGLIHCSHGFGFQRTWQYNTFIFPIPLALDHCLYTKGIHVIESYVAKDIGSDHRPIINIIEMND